jgi:hypothetical protein
MGERKYRPVLGLLVCCWLLSGCRDTSQDELLQKPISTRARESALAKSGLPGATGIGSALRVSDSADARRKREDSIANAVP